MRTTIGDGVIIESDIILSLSHIAGPGIKAAIAPSPLSEQPDQTSPEKIMQIWSFKRIVQQMQALIEQRFMSGLELTIIDWKLEGRDLSPQIDLRVLRSPSQCIIEAQDGRRVDIEIQDGNLRIMAYECAIGKESPVITVIPSAGEILTLRQDYDSEPRCDYGDAPGL